MKYLYSLFMLLLTGPSVIAQDPFVPSSLSSDVVFEIPAHACELAGGNFVFVGLKSDPDSAAFVFLTDHNGNVLKKKFLFAKLDTSDYVGYSCFLNDDKTISIIGTDMLWRDMKATNQLWFARIDSNLNLLLLRRTRITNPDTQLFYATHFVQINQSFFGAVSYWPANEADEGLAKYHTQLVKLNSEGVVVLKQDLDSSFFGGGYCPIGGITPISVSIDRAHLFFTTNLNGDRVVKVDTNFHLTDTIICNPSFYPFDRDTITNEWPPHCLEVSQDNLVLGSTVETNVFSSKPEYRWGVLKYNLSSRSVTGFGAFPINTDTLAYRLFTYGGRTMALSGSAFYTLGITGGFGLKGLSVIAKFDTSGRPLWIRYLGDRKRRSWSQSLVVCRDGSILVNAYSDSASSFLTTMHVQWIFTWYALIRRVEIHCLWSMSRNSYAQVSPYFQTLPKIM